MTLKASILQLLQLQRSSRTIERVKPLCAPPTSGMDWPIAAGLVFLLLRVVYTSSPLHIYLRRLICQSCHQLWVNALSCSIPDHWYSSSALSNSHWELYMTKYSKTTLSWWGKTVPVLLCILIGKCGFPLLEIHLYWWIRCCTAFVGIGVWSPTGCSRILAKYHLYIPIEQSHCPRSKLWILTPATITLHRLETQTTAFFNSTLGDFPSSFRRTEKRR